MKHLISYFLVGMFVFGATTYAFAPRVADASIANLVVGGDCMCQDSDGTCSAHCSDPTKYDDCHYTTGSNNDICSDDGSTGCGDCNTNEDTCK